MFPFQQEALKEYEGPLIKSVMSLFSFKIVATAGKMLLELTQVTQDNLTQTTQDNLLDVQGTLRALWATAQQLNARQKFELSIRYVFSTINIHWNHDTRPIC